jgi:imidazolonepropionase-like amidohydrolase
MKTVITGATLIDGTGNDPVEAATIVIDGNRIISVESRGAVPHDAQVLEADGMTVLPGLIDTHVHVMSNGFDLMRQLLTPPSLALYRAIPNLWATLDAGVTTVRDAGGAPKGLKMAIEEKIFPGPRMKISVTALSQTGGHGDSTMPNTCCLRVDWPDIPNGVVDGVENVRQRVREILRAGAEWIKVCSTGGVLSPVDLPSSSQFTVDELRAAVEEGRAHGEVKVMAHAQGTQGIKNAILAGCTSIEHGIWLDDEAIELMVARDVYLVPTLVAPVQVIRQAEAKPGMMPPYGLEKARCVIDDHHASFSRAVVAGVKIAMGTDSGVGPHGENAEELALMVAGGMTPMEAIVASTRRAAELLAMDDEIGTIAPGKLADLIIVAGDPLAGISILQNHDRIVLVMQDGETLKNRVAERASVHM